VITAPGSSTLAEAMQGAENAQQNMTALNVSGNATIADLTVTGAAQVRKLVVTDSAEFQGDIEINGHIVTGGATPTISAEAGSGSGATTTITGNDTSGTITITTGSAPAVGSLAKVTFAKPYASTPRIVMSPANDKTTAIQMHRGITSTSQAMFDASVAPQPNTVYEFDYFITQ
jgi:hypothetical protein